MASKQLVILVCSVQVILIGACILYIQHRQLSVQINLNLAALRDEWKVFNPQPELAYFYEPPASTTVTMYHSHFPENTSSVNTFNSDSLHEPREYNVEKAASTFRIVTLGDSFTFGAYLDTQYNYTELLEQTFNQSCTAYDEYEVLNLGMHGYDMTFSFERYRLRGEKYNPDLVTWFIKDEDFILNQNVLEKITRQHHADAIIKAVERGGNKDDVVYSKVLQDAMQEFAKISNPIDTVKKNFNHMANIQDIFNGPLLLFTAPGGLTLHLDERFPEFTTFFKKTNVYFTTDIGDINNPAYAIGKEDNHQNKLGNERIAQDLFKYLTSSNLVPCTENVTQ